MPPAGFESIIPASEGPQIYALDRAATRIGTQMVLKVKQSRYRHGGAQRIPGS